jgi:hypothetical protein
MRPTAILLASLFAVTAGAQTVQSNLPGTFVDISQTGGTALTGTDDDTLQVITTTIGNQMFPAGSASISNNGWALSGNLPGGGYFTNYDIPLPTGVPTGLPTGSYGGFLLPFWDDLYPVTHPSSNTIWWQEASGVLIIMWLNDLHFADSVAADSITFEIQIFANPGSGPPIQFLYNDTVFGGGYATSDNGLSATIGYVGANNPSGNGNARWSYNTASVSSGTILSFFPKFSVVPSSPLGAGSVQIAITSGPALGFYFLPLTFNPGAFPNGWFYGVDLSFQELSNEIGQGWPFYWSLDVNGSYTIGPFGGLPSGLTFYAAGLAAASGSNYPSQHSVPFSYTIP